ncbi:MAG: magnesium-translocating P-type ATPase [Sandaracinaceae bacterium]|nr:magnesium-translocating P-type ATPase [Sandaracinaceae bacterium]
MRVPRIEQYWSVATDKLLAALSSSAAGLDPTEAQARLSTYGPNQLSAAHRGPLAEAVISQLRNPLLWLLLFAAIVGGLAGELVNSGIVLLILLLGSLISVVQESRAGHALAHLRERVALRARVVRGGSEQDVLATSVVPGDILVLGAGTMVAADAVLLSTRDLYMGEAALTGEPFAVEKRATPVDASAGLAARTNVVHMGTSVRSGMGRAVVVQTGAATAFGQVAGRLALRQPETDFQRGLRRFGYLLMSLMVVLVFVVFAASAVRHHPPVEALLFAVALAVGLAPEMLPAVLATMLARGAKRMAERGVLVRRLEATENLGNMDVLCTDKTGTLTAGEVALESATDPAGDASPDALRLAFWNARLQGGLPNPLDRALVDAGSRHSLPLPEKLDEIPFDFMRKRLSVLVRTEAGAPLLVTKGAAAAVLGVCDSVRSAAGSVTPLDAAQRVALDSRLAAWSEEGVRVIGLATRAWVAGEPVDRASEAGMVFEGFATFRDPPKPGVQQALADLGGLGVRVKVISGDHHAVVAHLARQIGMRFDRVVRGADIAQLRDDALRHVADTADIFAEIDPTQKERIVLALKQTGHVVGFMGDGINDAPALYAADVGISVDGATDVAREAADFVLLKQDLGTVCAGVREGRATFANTLKYVLTTESANLGNMVSMAFASLFLPFLPLLAHQVLLNNLLSDVPSTALAGDRVDPEVMEQPQRWDVTFIRRYMIAFGLISALFDGLTFIALTRGFGVNPEEFRTAWFVESLLTELFVLLVLRTRRRFWKSRPHAALLASTLVVACVTFVLPWSPLRTELGFVTLPGSVWLFVVGVTVLYVGTVEAVKGPLVTRLMRGRAPKATSPLGKTSHHLLPR